MQISKRTLLIAGIPPSTSRLLFHRHKPSVVAAQELTARGFATAARAEIHLSAHCQLAPVVSVTQLAGMDGL